MKQTSIIPLLKFESGALPFRAQTIKKITEEQDEKNEGAHSHNYYEMIWLTKGSGTLYADRHEYVIESNTIFCLTPNQTHRFRINEEMEGFSFLFTESFFRMNEYDMDWANLASLFQLFSEGPTISISGEMDEDIKGVALQLIKEFESVNFYRVELLKRYFKIVLIYLSGTKTEYKRSFEQSRETQLVKKFMELLDKNFKENKMVSEYAEQLLVTSNYLNRIVNKITGYSAGHQIRQRVVLEAKRIGRYSDAGMKEIAYDLGFLDSAHFSRFFKTFGGVNFTDFKREGLIVPLNVTFNRA